MSLITTDTLGMFDLAVALPDQAAVAERAATSVALDSIDASAIRNVVSIGMGGSGIGADILAAIAAVSATVPIVVVKDHTVPAFVNRETLVLATSFSGNTAETLDAVRAAHTAGGRVVALTAGGALGALAREWRIPVVALDASIPMPRAAVAAVSIPLIVVLGRLGLLDGYEREVASAIEQLRRRVSGLAADGSVARQLARRIGRTIPLIYGTCALGGVAAYRWKCQFNENSKCPAFFHTVPELNHNEIAGWGQHGDVTRQVLSAVHLRHDYEPPRAARSYEFITEVQEEVVAAVHEVRAQGDTRLAQLFDLIAIGDFTSLYHAAQEGLDPGPIPTLDDLKRRLG